VIETTLDRPVRSLTRCPGTYASSFAVEELDVTLHGGQVMSLFLKHTAPSNLAPAAAEGKPLALLDPVREIEVYRQVLAPWGLDVPACLAAGADRDSERYWLLLEAIDGIPLWQSGDPAAWDAAARWLGKMHSRGAPSAPPELVDYDAAYLRGQLARAVALTPAGALERVAAGWPRVVERLAAWPPALVHGDFYPANVLVEGTSGAPRIRPVDWDMAGIGPGLLDLAALTSGRWTADVRRRLALAYHATWHPRAVRPPERELLEVLELARLFVAIHWLGRSERWTPPPEHAHDWLGAALDAAARIGL
jgi:Ser/Thr protein kinase RdoA (MazF antagonist)